LTGTILHHRRLGIRANAEQVVLLVVINGFVGATLGLERTLIPLIAGEEFLGEGLSLLSVIGAFGLAKACANLFAGKLQHTLGRKKTLIAGWLIALPVPVILMIGSWSWIVAANLLLGISQGLTWSTTVVMKVDIAGRARRGLAVGLNEAAGYIALGVSAWLTGYLAQLYGPRPIPFYPGIAFVLSGLVLSLFVKETLPFLELEQETEAIPKSRYSRLNDLWAVAQAGLTNNLNDALVWGVFPILLAARGIEISDIATTSAIYPIVWGVFQLGTGTLSDRFGTQRFIVAGMLIQSVALVLIASASEMMMFTFASALLGIGTGMSYPALLTAAGHLSHVQHRSRTIGQYRFWRDMGFVAGAIVISLGLPVFGAENLFWFVAAITAISGSIYAFN
jgi:MFS family permease